MPTVTSVLHHHIGTESVYERGLDVTTARAAYEAHIDWLTRRYSIVDLDQVLSGDLPPRPLLLTFDDVFRSVLVAVREVLAPRGLPCVCFVNPGLLSDHAISLDSTIVWAVHKAGLEAVCAALELPTRTDVGQVIVHDMAGFSATERTQLRDRLLDRYGPADLSDRAPLMTPDDIRELVTLGAEIGNHTATHVHCRSLTGPELQTEIVAAKAQLETLSAQKVRSFAVPYGHEDDLTQPVLDTLRGSGHDAIFLVHGRSNLRRPASDIWYRTSLLDQTPGKLRQTLTLLPLMRSLKRLARRAA